MTVQAGSPLLCAHPCGVVFDAGCNMFEIILDVRFTDNAFWYSDMDGIVGGFGSLTTH